MSENSKIEWTDHTFNPWIGCTKVSPGCAHCYAETLMDTRRGRAQWGKGKPRVRTAASTWNEPRKWNKAAASYPDQCTRCSGRLSMAAQVQIGNTRCPAQHNDKGKFDPSVPVCGGEVALNVRPRVFCASLCDVFDDEVPIEWLADLLALIDDCKNLDWQLLTKRPENIASRMNAAMHGNFDDRATFAVHMPHVWLGTSVENQEMANQRIPALLSIKCNVRFLSCEPLLGPVDLSAMKLEPSWPEFLYWPLEGKYISDGMNEPRPSMGAELIHWIICGGESGPGARPMDPAWARSLRDQATAAGVAFHFKQWGGVNKKAAGRELDGRTWDELPTPRKP